MYIIDLPRHIIIFSAALLAVLIWIKTDRQSQFRETELLGKSPNVLNRKASLAT